MTEGESFFYNRLESQALVRKDLIELLDLIRDFRKSESKAWVLVSVELRTLIRLGYEDRVIRQVLTLLEEEPNAAWLWSVLAEAYTTLDEELAVGCFARAVLLHEPVERAFTVLHAAPSYAALVFMASQPDLEDLASLTDHLLPGA